MSKESISKIHLILEKIDYIEQIVQNAGSITHALEDTVTQRPALCTLLQLLNNLTNSKKIMQKTY